MEFIGHRVLEDPAKPPDSCIDRIASPSLLDHLQADGLQCQWPEVFRRDACLTTTVPQVTRKNIEFTRHVQDSESCRGSFSTIETGLRCTDEHRQVSQLAIQYCLTSSGRYRDRTCDPFRVKEVR